MKIFKALLSIIFFCLLLVVFSSPISSCTKTTVQHDTTVKVVNDTTTLTITDTIFDLRTGLIAYYNFVNGNLNDSSGNGNTITFNNCVATKDRFGNANGAYTFSGGSFMKVSNSVSLNPSQITLMAIVKFNGFYSGSDWGNQILMKGGTDQSQGIYGLRIHPQSYDNTMPLDTTKENFGAFYGDAGNTGIIDTSSNIHSGVWSILVYTWDGYQSKLYVNGILKTSRYAPLGAYVNSNDLYIGKTENPSFPYNFTGDIDEIRIYSKALTPELVLGFNTLTK